MASESKTTPQTKGSEMTRFALNTLGAVLTACATVSLMSLVLRYDYDMPDPTTPRAWVDVMVVICASLLAGLFFTAANTYKDRK